MLIRSLPARLKALERILKQTPTWLFVSGEVLVLALIALWVEEDVNIRSLRDVVRVVFQNAEPIAIVAAVILYFKEIPARVAQKHYEAWQVIDNASAAGVSTSYARFKALEDLNQDRVSLCGIDIPGANLQGINLQGANLSCADLRGANLMGANLNRADLRSANLTNANLFYAVLSHAILIDADVRHANLNSADLSDADCTGANLQHVDFVFATLRRTDFRLANLSHADFMMADFTQSDLTDATLHHVKQLLPAQIKQAQNWHSAAYDPNMSIQLGLPESG